MKNFTTYDLYKLPTWIRHFYYTKQFRKLSEIITGQSGYVLENTLYKRFKKFEVGGNTFQDGTPTLENQIPLQNVVGTIVNKVSNKNLFDKNDTTLNRYIEASTGLMKGLQGSSASGYINIADIENLIMNGETSMKTNGGAFYNSNKEYISGFTTRQICDGINVPSGSSFVRVTTTTELLNVIQIEPGTTATPYVPHEEQTAEFTLLEGQFLATGEKLKDDGIHKTRYKFFPESVTGVVQDSNTGLYYCYITNLPKKVDTSKLSDMYSTHFIGVRSINIGHFYLSSESTLVFILNDQTLTTTQAVDNWLQEQSNNGTPVEFEFILDESELPIIIPYNATQQTQYNAIKNAKTYKDTTIVTATSEGANPILNLQYWQENVEEATEDNFQINYVNQEENPNRVEFIEDDTLIPEDSINLDEIENDISFLDFVEEIGDIEESEENENESD